MLTKLKNHKKLFRLILGINFEITQRINTLLLLFKTHYYLMESN